MFNLSDTELDRLSRQAAEAYEVENSSSSWEALAAKLDKELGVDPGSPAGIHSPRGFRFFRSPFAYGSLVILVAASSYFLSKPFKQNNKANMKSEQVVLQNQQGALDKPTGQNNAAISTENNKTTNPQNDKQTDDKGLSKSVDKSPSDRNSISSKNTNKEKAESIKANTASAEHRVADAPKQELASAKKTGSNATVDNVEGSNKTVGENGITGNKNGLVEANIVDKTFSHQNQWKNKNTSGIHNKNHPTQELASSNSIALNKKDHSNNKPDNNGIVDDDVSNVDNNKGTHAQSSGLSTMEESLGYAPAQQVSNISNRWRIAISDSLLLAEAAKLEAKKAILTGKKNNHSLHIKQPLQIGLVVAPDFSKVKYTYNNSRLGGSIGLTLDVQLLHRLSLNTGLIYAQKYYQADDESIHLQPSMVPSYIRVDFMSASCKMMEIPLNLRYDVSVEGNNRFFLSTGLSSYLMQNQSYIYYYHNPIGYQGWRQNSYNTPENFWFSMLNLSAGFESAIAKNFSIQVEPYIKVPLKGVGIGNVSLSSYGINLGVKYAPVLKRARK
ncbi:MAG: outer membrane beta-barrel protein [Bacteroidetes bacterium]|nr:outer membrane beta-barrel protein [Bacteroidota bacterium]